MGRLLSLVVFVVVAAAVWWTLPEKQVVPDVTFNLVDGRQLTSPELRGQPLLVNFWSVSCSICLEDMPKVSRIADSLRERDLRVIGVAMPYDPPPAVAGIVERLAPSYDIAYDVQGEIAKAFGDVALTPTTFLLDREGQIAYRAQGPIDETRIRATFLTL